MKGDAKPLVKFLEGADNRFIIPVYQRNYNWKQDNCKQLFNDLVKVIRNDRESHFFGSIVSALYEGHSSSEYLIIDGQQRITTISLLLLAVVNLAKNREMEFENPRLLDKIWKTYLIDEFVEENKIRLKHVKHDYEAFKKLLFEEEREYDNSSNVTQNYKYFYNRIKDQHELTLDEIYLSITKLVIIDIFLHREDDAQLIFESLNSTGLDLEEGDKIRNFVLMSLTPRTQEEFYKKYWHKIEKNTDYNVSAFIRDYLTLKQNRISSFKNIYVDFKDYVEAKNLGIEEILKELCEYSIIYKNILTNSIGNSELNTVLARINQLEMSVTYPFLLSLFQQSENNQIEEDELTKILEVIEIYLFRRFITGVVTSALNKIFMTLHKDILRIKKEESYCEVLKYVLLSKTGSGQFPNDEDFIRSFSTKNLYHIVPKNREYLFERLEVGNNLEHSNVIEKIREGTYTVEHIMPQTLTTQWKSELGQDAEVIHKTWLHRIANLTLTAYNSKYSNRSFIEKKELPDEGFRESGIKLNQYISRFNTWTLTELESRKDYLNDKALKLWPFPTSTFIPEEKPADIHGLDEEDMNFTGYLIKAFSFDEVTQRVESWREMFVTVMELIYEKNPAAINRLADRTEFLSLIRIPSNGYVPITESIYLYKDNSTMTKISVLRKVFDECNMDKGLLQLEVYLAGGMS